MPTGIQVQEFLLSDVPEVNPGENNIFVAAVQPNSDLEQRMRQYSSVLVNLYGSNPSGRPQTPAALATMIRAARQFDGLLRLKEIVLDDLSGIASLALNA